MGEKEMHINVCGYYSWCKAEATKEFKARGKQKSLINNPKLVIKILTTE